MKKRSKSKAEKTDLPELVTVMTKLVERLESLEKKSDWVIGRITDLPQEMRRAFHDTRRSEPSHQVQQPSQHPVQGSPQTHVPRERTLYQAVCADCRKNCEVPFKPTGERPVYCKECFARRKSGHIPQDPDRRVEALQQQRKLIMPSQGAIQGIAPKNAAPFAREHAAKTKKRQPPKKKKKK